MTWLVPALVATLAGTFVLAFVFYYLYVQERRSFLGIWASSWVVYALRYGFMLWLVTGGPEAWLQPAYLLAALVSGVLLLWGTYRFLAKPMPAIWLGAAAVCLPWVVFSGMYYDSLTLVSFPVFIFLGLAYIRTGTVLLAAPLTTGLSKKITGWAFIVWGIHKLDYPLLRPLTWFAPWGYLMGSVLEIMVALGMLLLYFQRNAERLRASEKSLARLNRELEQKYQEQDRELHQVHDQLVRQKKMAAVGRLAASVRHDLRNPLGVINNSVYYLKIRLSEADEKIRRHLDILEEQVRKADAIIGELLDFSKEVPLSVEKMDINRLLVSVAEDMMLSEQIVLETDLADTLPVLHLDPDQMKRVFQNIFTNAVQAMDGAGKLTVVSREMDGEVEIRISDTGPGISEENLPRIFDPLFTTREKGIGLGLCIVKDIVERHNGGISVESRPGEGATVIVRLPVA